VGPSVRIRFAPAASLQTLGPASQNGFGRAGNRHQHAAPQDFEKSSGHHLVIEYATAGKVEAKVAADEAIDVQS
jgi:hypothetical protein